MNEFAIMKKGQVRTVITTLKSRAKVAADWPGFTVAPLVTVDAAILNKYEYFEERASW